jgi:hypothetical protein
MLSESMTPFFAILQNQTPHSVVEVLLLVSLFKTGVIVDNNISARFFRIDPEDLAGGNFEAILVDIFSHPLIDREKDIGAEAGESIKARLERLTIDGDFVFGEFIRRQTDNKPPEANSEGLRPLVLAEGGGLGHSCVFSLSPPYSNFLSAKQPIWSFRWKSKGVYFCLESAFKI